MPTPLPPCPLPNVAQGGHARWQGGWRGKYGGKYGVWVRMNHADAGLASETELEARKWLRAWAPGAGRAQAGEEGDLGSSEQGRGRCELNGS